MSGIFQYFFGSSSCTEISLVRSLEMVVVATAAPAPAPWLVVRQMDTRTAEDMPSRCLPGEFQPSDLSLTYWLPD